MSTQVTRPTKEEVRALMARDREGPLDMEQVKRELCWHLVEAEREAVARREAQRTR